MSRNKKDDDGDIDEFDNRAVERRWLKDEKTWEEDIHLCPALALDVIQYCPLYVESHNTRASGFGCVDDASRPCQVLRKKMKYETAVAGLRAIDPVLVARCEFNRDGHVRREQINRNMRNNGIQ